MAEVDLKEYRELERAIKEMERVQAASPQGASPLLARTLENARKRIAEIEREIKIEQRQTAQAAEYAIAIQNETALNSSEKEIFGGLLLKRFFTKQDWKQLDSFYELTWDKLTDQGKAEISHRLWEGLRHGEGTFSDLPPHVKEKEAEQLYSCLVKRKNSSIHAEAIPEIDRKEFIKAFESGNNDKAYEILNRPGFRENISISTTLPVRSEDVTVGQDRNRDTFAEKFLAADQRQSTEVSPRKSLAELDLSSIDLSGLKTGSEVTASVAPVALGANNVAQKGL